MTIGPAPMMRMVEISVRLGMVEIASRREAKEPTLRER
jgi:hypothetical protein